MGGVESRVDFVKAFKAHMLAEAFLAADIDGDFVLSLDEMRVLAGDDSVQVQTRSSLACIWLCTLAVASVATIAAETIKGSSPCEFAPGTRLGQLERLETGCSH